MKPIVIYQSHTGFTEQYAHWTASELSCPVIPLSSVTVDNLSPYDVVIFGGWVRAGLVMGLEKIKTFTPNLAAAFAVGTSPLTPQIIAEIQERNGVGTLPIFYMQGGIRFEKLGFFYAALLRMAVKYIRRQDRKKNPTLATQPVATVGSYDASDKAAIQPLLDYITSR